MWKIVPLCLWREMNDISFDDCEKTLEEIKSLIFNTLYLRTVAFVSPLVIFLFFLSFLVRWLLLYTSCVLRDALRF